MRLESIGKNIRAFRLQRKLRQEDLAERAGLSVTYVGMIERGEKIPALDTLISILNVLNVSADMVLADVVTASYVAKSSMLGEKLEKVCPSDRARIEDVVDTLVRHARINI